MSLSTCWQWWQRRVRRGGAKSPTSCSRWWQRQVRRRDLRRAAAAATIPLGRPKICDSTGDLTALFYGRSRIAGLMCGSRVRFRGQVGIKDGARVMVNPAYELIVPHVSGQND